MATSVQISRRTVLLASGVPLLGCGKTEQPRTLRATVSEDGKYTLEGRPISEFDLKHDLRALRSEGKPIELHIFGTERTKYADVGKLIVAAQDAGIEKIGFVTEPPRAIASSALSASGTR